MKRNNGFFVFPATKFTIVLRNQQMTTGCEFNPAEPLNKGILVLVEFFTSHHPVHMFTCPPPKSTRVHYDLTTPTDNDFNTKEMDSGKQKELLFLALSYRSALKVKDFCLLLKKHFPT